MRKPWYEKLFENYANNYDKECFTQGTIGECDFIERELKNDRTLRILDVGCGTGRHSIELAKRGYKMTGIDLSKAQIDRAIEKAHTQNLCIEFLVEDARKLPFVEQFDSAIMMCEGGFSLMETDEMNAAIIQSVANALNKEGKLIMTTLNGLYQLLSNENLPVDSKDEQPVAKTVCKMFDLMTFREIGRMVYTDDQGIEHELEYSERYYVPSEMTWLLKSVGFSNIEIFGATLGAFSREDKLSADHFEMLIVAEKDANDENPEEE